MDTKVKENAILKEQKKYSPSQLVHIDSIIRMLAKDHYKYGKHMPLVYGKARGIQSILNIFYNTDVSVYYVWSVLEDFQNEPEGGWNND